MFKKDKKAMGVQQVFAFIVAAITFSMIMMFGYGAINDFLEKGEQVEFFQFKTSLESSIKKIYSEYGAERQIDYNLPAKYSQICFVDLDKEYNSELCEKDIIACDVWEDAQDSNLPPKKRGWEAVGENVFLKPSSLVELKVYKININEGYLCLPINNGKFSLHLKGLGSKTKLSEATYN